MQICIYCTAHKLKYSIWTNLKTLYHWPVISRHTITGFSLHASPAEPYSQSILSSDLDTSVNGTVTKKEPYVATSEFLNAMIHFQSSPCVRIISILTIATHCTYTHMWGCGGQPREGKGAMESTSSYNSSKSPDLPCTALDLRWLLEHEWDSREKPRPEW